MPLIARRPRPGGRSGCRSHPSEPESAADRLPEPLEEEYVPSRTAARFEEWEFPDATVLGCAAAVRYARAVGVEAISQRTPQLAGRLRTELETAAGIRALDHGRRLGALVTIAVEGWQPAELKAALDARGINSALSFRNFAQFDFGDKDIDWCLRLSPHYYNSDDEVDQVVAALTELQSTH